ncbi:FAD-linked oxidase C-terminal domain-containing protein [Neomegalonema sp.]|uniref:FAD-linked oxidase C-terminal domain-containing protein n=1 Tax=Neomegalonema sp. TaxID=2039713 RepID=UPI002639EDC0|nr:FAD-linked oxidase C-terminal domain-containing protein [Neomegalonema sp.]MDD2868214.1 FAD-linked oxidase C-terminal domain-containing protein [Neomegalonema sp.]
MEKPTPDAAVLARRDEILAGLRRILPPRAVVSDEESLRAYECDALTAYRQIPLVVALPGSAAEAAALMRHCAEEGIPVTPRGAGTSLTGGALPGADCVTIGMARLNQVLEIDPQARVARVQAGATNLSVSRVAAPEGFFYAPDPSSQLACSIGGNVAMNSGGAHCLKYGVTLNNLLGVTLVTPAGEVLEIGGAHMDSPGLDLLGVVCGSEGLLGLVTDATLRLTPLPEGARPALIGFDSAEAAGACVAAIIEAGLAPVAMEFMDRPCILACEAFARPNYPDCEALLIVEAEGSEAEIREQLARIESVAARFRPVALRVSASEAESAAIWAGRKAAFGAMGALGDYICLDGVTPLSRLPEILTAIAALAEKYGLRVSNVFHAGDGNLHPLIVFDANKPGDLEKAEACGAEILRLCVEMGGCLTGEHGVGVEKRELMSAQFAPHELDLQMAVKSAFDPGWRMNPGKVFPLAAVRAFREAAE